MSKIKTKRVFSFITAFVTATTMCSIQARAESVKETYLGDANVRQVITLKVNGVNDGYIGNSNSTTNSDESVDRYVSNINKWESAEKEVINFVKDNGGSSTTNTYTFNDGNKIINQHDFTANRDELKELIDNLYDNSNGGLINVNLPNTVKIDPTWGSANSNTTYTNFLNMFDMTNSRYRNQGLNTLLSDFSKLNSDELYRFNADDGTLSKINSLSKKITLKDAANVVNTLNDRNGLSANLGRDDNDNRTIKYGDILGYNPLINTTIGFSNQLPFGWDWDEFYKNYVQGLADNGFAEKENGSFVITDPTKTIGINNFKTIDYSDLYTGSSSVVHPRPDIIDGGFADTTTLNDRYQWLTSILEATKGIEDVELSFITEYEIIDVINNCTTDVKGGNYYWYCEPLDGNGTSYLNVYGDSITQTNQARVAFLTSGKYAIDCYQDVTATTTDRIYYREIRYLVMKESNNIVYSDNSFELDHNGSSNLNYFEIETDSSNATTTNTLQRLQRFIVNVNDSQVNKYFNFTSSGTLMEAYNTLRIK